MRILSGEQYQEEQKLDVTSEQDDQALDETVLEIIKQVRENGDQALISYTEQFDGVALENLRVTEAEFEEAKSLVSVAFTQALKKAAERIKSFHENQIEKSTN